MLVLTLPKLGGRKQLLTPNLLLGRPLLVSAAQLCLTAVCLCIQHSTVFVPCFSCAAQSMPAGSKAEDVCPKMDRSSRVWVLNWQRAPGKRDLDLIPSLHQYCAGQLLYLSLWLFHSCAHLAPPELCGQVGSVGTQSP